MARTPRSDVFDPDTIGVYHCYNRIVRRSFLCGLDPHTGKDYSYRREWLYQRVKYLARYFAIDVLGYAILSNHFHLVLRNRPDLVEAMDDSQVVTAWLMICPKSQRQADGTALPPTEAEIRAELHKPGQVARLRRRLSNPSWLMRQASQYMGIRCNAEDAMRGHFWESRFGMKRLLDEAAVLACLAYVDLNPQRAHLADSPEAYPYVSIGERLRTLEGEPINSASWLAPIALESETGGQPVRVVNRMSREERAEAVAERSARPLGCLPMRLDQYAELLRWLSAGGRTSTPPGEQQPTKAPGPNEGGLQILRQLGLDPREFAELVHDFSRRFFTAAGSRWSLEREAARRGRRRLYAPGRGALTGRSAPTAPA